MTDVQQKVFELFLLFKDVCEKLGIKYYLVCGSALGAVKYKGFIPWDDDMDVGLLRDDYELFIKEAQSMLPDYVFVQNYKTDPKFPMLMTKLRNSNTTFIEKMTANLDINHGVYLDVFPLDGYPKDKLDIALFERKKGVYERRRAAAFDYKRRIYSLGSLRSTAVYWAYKYLGIGKDTQKTLKKYEALLKKYPPENSDYICNFANWQGKLEYAKKEQYADGYNTLFEQVEVRIPEKYDDYLRQKYGDYTKDPEKEAQSSNHNIAVCDMTKPYTYYKN